MDQQNARGYAMSLRNQLQINMTNCYKHCEHFFKRCKSIHFNVLIAYWIMAGYLGPVDSVEEAYRKGHDILMDLIYNKGILRQSYEGEGIVELDESKRSELMACWGHEGFCMQADLGFIDLVGLDELRRVACTDGTLKTVPECTQEQQIYTRMQGSLLLIDGNHLSRQTLHFPNGLDYLAYFNPVLGSLEVLLKDEVNLSVLLLRKCEWLREEDFSFIRLKNLTVLEISGSSYLSTIHLENISQLTQLRCLNLSNLLIDKLPSYFFNDLLELRWVILRGCSELASLSSTRMLKNLMVLDLSHCTALRNLQTNVISNPQLQMLDLSHTALSGIPALRQTKSLTHLFLRDSKVSVLNSLKNLTSLIVLDLSGARSVQECRQVQGNTNLVHLDLSGTCIRSVDFLPHLIHLRKLTLQKCNYLRELPGLQSLTNLEELDISGCENLVALPEGLSEVVNVKESAGLEFDSVETSSSLSTQVEIESVRRSIPDEHGIVFSYNDISRESGFHRFIDEFENLLTRIPVLRMDRGMNEVRHSDSNTFFDRHARSSVQTETSRMHVSRIINDLHYIRDNILVLDRSPNRESCEELLHALIHSTCKLNEFIHIIVKLKLLIHPIQVDGLEKEEVDDDEPIDEEKEVDHDELIGKEVDDDEPIEMNEEEEEEEEKKVREMEIKIQKQMLKQRERQRQKDKKKLRLRSKISKTVSIGIVKEPSGMEKNFYPEDAFNSLSLQIQNCLLCFSVFPSSHIRDKRTSILKLKSLVIKKRMLIHWWFGEGFINEWDVSGPEEYVSYQNENTSTIGEIGNDTLKKLEQMGFIEPVMKKGRASGSCCMRPHVHAFVTKKAKEKGFFDLDNENGKLTPSFSRSKKACLLTSKDNYELGEKYSNSLEEIEYFKDVHTMLNVNESSIDVNVKWFSRMKELSVLHLGSWHSKNVDPIMVEGQKFLEDLNTMKKLRLVNLRGLFPIMKLPDSVSHLTELRILDLRGCSYLQKLPGDIGSLINLVHLDITNCLCLCNLPKGISLLSKLEVLKGFRITDKLGHRKKHRKMCILEDLLHLRRLSKLSLFVKSQYFPTQKDAHVLNGLSSLRELKITWEMYQQGEAEQLEEPNPNCCNWLQRICWVPRLGENDEVGDNTSKSNVRKLVLRWLPNETILNRLVSSEWEDLDELHIIGGYLQTIPVYFQKLNVKTLRLKFLRNLDISWPNLKDMFPLMEYLEICECTKHIFPCDAQGVWRK